jgi:asparagine synthase (glutamine-hydrolysing)
MCGIAGYIDLSRSTGAAELQAAVTRMADTMAHRGPDSAGAWTDPANGIGLSHRRLSILDLSPDGHQPMISACGRYVIVFNGEIYNFETLRRELQGSGSAFRGGSDTEVMLAAISRWGLERAVRRFNGMFAFAVWDRREHTLSLVRDRLGEKPLYYGAVNGKFVFASELKAIRATAGPLELDRGAIRLYLRHCYIPAPYSIYTGINKLPPGTLVAFRPDAPSARHTPEPYWSAKSAAEAGTNRPFSGSSTEAADELHGLLTAAVKLRMRADVPLGAFLSGGIDSSTVVALMQSESSRPVKTFSIGFTEDGYDEAPHAKAVARLLGTDHTEAYVTPEDAMAVIPRLASMYDEPFADSSQIPTRLVSQLAREKVTVALSGDGGDELFGGYTRYAIGRKLSRYLSCIPRPLRGPLSSTAKRLGGFPGVPQRKFDRIVEFLQAGDSDAMYLQLTSHWSGPDPIVHGAIEPPTALTGAPPARLRGLTHRMMYFDTVMYLPDDILVKLDRASMSVSLESRVPLLDHNVVEFAWSLPYSLLNHTDGRSKWPLRQVLYRYVPPALVDRPKKGFGIPLGSWLRGPLRDWAASLLDERRLVQEGIFEPGPIIAKWREHAGGQNDWHYHLWDVLMFQAWLDESAGNSQCHEATRYARVEG